MTTDDIELVRQYARHHSEEAFAALVSRHVNLVYSVALRQLGDVHLAEEVTQAAFIILAQKADSLGSKTILSAWLCRTARYVACRALRTQRRRQNRVQEVYMQTLSNQPESESSPWPDIAPLLDSAMAGLDEKDHSAIVLRFLESKDLRQIGAALGVSENAARKRVNRALERLRSYFSKRGVKSTTAIIAGVISANSVQVAPAALAQSVTAVAIAKGATASASTLTLIKGALKLMAWTKAKMAMVVAAGVVACLLVAGIGIFSVSRLMDPSIRGIPSDWLVLDGDPKGWHWANGKINVHGNAGDALLVSKREYRDFTMSAIVDAGTREASMAFHMQDVDHGYVVLFVPAGTAWAEHHPSYLVLAKRYIDANGNHHEETLAVFEGKKFADVGPKAKIEVTARGSLIEVRLNGVKVLKAKDGTYPTGRIGLRTAGDAEVPSDATFSKLTIHEYAKY